MTDHDIQRLATAFRTCLDAPESECVTYAAIWKVAGAINRAFEGPDWNPGLFVEYIEYPPRATASESPPE